jgi:hypothetical protein
MMKTTIAVSSFILLSVQRMTAVKAQVQGPACGEEGALPTLCEFARTVVPWRSVTRFSRR